MSISDANLSMDNNEYVFVINYKDNLVRIYPQRIMVWHEVVNDVLPDAEGRHWQLRADTGWVSPKGEELRLRGNVAGDSPQDGSTPPTTFRTTALDVFPERSLARTAEPVTMARPGLRQSGVGFEADLKSRQYSLLSQVKTRYEPNAAR